MEETGCIEQSPLKYYRLLGFCLKNQNKYTIKTYFNF